MSNTKKALLVMVISLVMVAVPLAGCASAKWSDQPAGTIPFKILTTSFPGVTVGTAYNQILESTSGTGTLTWTISPVPNWLTQGASGNFITGTPKVAGTYAFTLSVKDSAGHSDSVQCSIVVT